MPSTYLLGCASFVDLLTPCSILSKVMQHDDLDILSVLTSLLRSVIEIEKFTLSKWSTYLALLGKCNESDSTTAYQSQGFKKFVEAKMSIKENYKVYCSKVRNCLKFRLAWSDLQMLRDIILVLAILVGTSKGTSHW